MLRTAKHLLSFQLGNPFIGKPKVTRKDLAIVFAQKGRVQLERLRKCGEAQRERGNMKNAADAIVNRAYGPAFHQMWMLHRLLDRQHWCVRDSRLTQNRKRRVGTRQD